MIFDIHKVNSFHIECVCLLTKKDGSRHRPQGERRQALQKGIFMTNPPEQSRCALFDNIKAVCILFVVLTHLPWTDVWRSRLLFPFWVDMAVPFFLLISAVLRTQKLDYNRGEGGRTRLCWSPKQLRRAFGRLMCPYIVIAVIELLADLVLHRALVPTDSAKAFLYWLCTGLTGPGSYYVPIMVQFTLFFPCIAVLFSKNRHIGLLSCFFAESCIRIRGAIAPVNHISSAPFPLSLSNRIGHLCGESEKKPNRGFRCLRFVLLRCALHWRESSASEPLVSRLGKHLYALCAVRLRYFLRPFPPSCFEKYARLRFHNMRAGILSHLFNPNAVLRSRRRSSAVSVAARSPCSILRNFRRTFVYNALPCKRRPVLSGRTGGAATARAAYRQKQIGQMLLIHPFGSREPFRRMSF